MNSEKLNVSFDFDSTLSESKIQILAKKYLAIGAGVYVTTSRRNEMGSLKFSNSDLFDVTDKIGIKRENITFTNFEEKYNYVKSFDLHFDDDEHEVNLINDYPGNCIGVLCEPNSNKAEKKF